MKAWRLEIYSDTCFFYSCSSFLWFSGLEILLLFLWHRRFASSIWIMEKNQCFWRFFWFCFDRWSRIKSEFSFLTLYFDIRIFIVLSCFLYLLYQLYELDRSVLVFFADSFFSCFLCFNILVWNFLAKSFCFRIYCSLLVLMCIRDQISSFCSLKITWLCSYLLLIVPFSSFFISRFLVYFRSSNSS